MGIFTENRRTLLGGTVQHGALTLIIMKLKMTSS